MNLKLPDLNPALLRAWRLLDDFRGYAWIVALFIVWLLLSWKRDE